MKKKEPAINLPYWSMNKDSFVLYIDSNLLHDLSYVDMEITIHYLCCHF